MTDTLTNHCGYNAGHPWYYLLGGKVPTPKQILNEVKRDDYRGYARDDIAAADKKSEPQRSEALRKFQAKFTDGLKQDLNIYRRTVRELIRQRETQVTKERPVSCDDVHVSMSLKVSHLTNDFAHLVYLEELLSHQGDLFGF